MMIRRIAKIASLFFGAIVLIFLIAGALSQTRFFKDWLRDRIVSAGKESINGEVRLGRIDGNLLTRFGFADLAILQNADTVVYVPRVEIALQPMALMRRVLQLSSVEMYAPRLVVKQREDGSLNLSDLVRPGNGESPASWAVRLGSFTLSGAQIGYTALDTARQVIPRHILLRHAEISGSLVNDRLALNVDHLRLETFLPGLEVKSLTAEISAAGDSLRLMALKLATANSNLAGDITVQSLKNADFNIDIQIASLLLDELHPFLTEMKTRGTLGGRVHAMRSQGVLRLDVKLDHAASAAQFIATLDETDSTYAVEGVVSNLDFSKLGIEPSRRSSINARFTAEGRGFDVRSAATHAIVWFDTSRFGNFQLPRFEVEARLDRGRLKTRADYFSPLGAASVDAGIENLFGKPAYRFLVSLKDFDVMKFYASLMARQAAPSNGAEPALLNTKLSLTCSGSGRSFDPDSLQMSARLDAIASEIGMASIDSLMALIDIHDKTIHVDSLFWSSPTADVSAAGTLSFALVSDVRFRGKLGNLELIRRLVEADSLRAGGWFVGNITGPADSIVVQAEYSLHDVVWNTASMKAINGKMDFHGEMHGGAATLGAGDLLLGVVPLDTAMAEIQYDLDRMNFQSSFSRGAESRGEVDGRYAFGDTARLDVDRADIFLIGQKWQKSETPMWINIGDEVYHFHNVILESGGQRISAEGRLDYLGEEDLTISIENLDLAGIAAFMGRGQEWAGMASSSARFLGSASAPLLQGTFEVHDGRLFEFRFPLAKGSLGYADQRFFWDVELQQNDNLSLIGEGFLPMNLALDNTGEVLLRDRPMRVQFNTNGLDLSFLQAIFPKLKNLYGLLAFNISAENTLAKLRPTGYVYVLNGGFEAPTLGMKYRDVQLSATIDTSFVELQNVKVVSDDGTMVADGRLDLDLTTPAKSNLVAAVRANNFMVLHNRDVDLRINADMRVGGPLEQVGFAGDLTVVRSRLFLPALQQSSALKIDESMPTKAAADSGSAPANQFMDRLLKKTYGELQVIVPRNTWLRSPEMNVEIEGELDLIIHESDFLLFGTIKVVRGTYELYGSKFSIDQGTLTFQGNKDMLPEIDLDASRVFRNEVAQQKQTLRIDITGRADAPKITFQLDDTTIEEKDAVAYLIFGRSFDELAQGQKDDTKKLTTSTIASGLLSGLVSKQISNALAKSLSLDVIEFQSGEGLELDKSRVLVGKYVTNDLFLSYTRDFSSADALNVSLEYEISKFLFLQAARKSETDTGFDLIWKWEW